MAEASVSVAWECVSRFSTRQSTASFREQVRVNVSDSGFPPCKTAETTVADPVAHATRC